MLRISRVAVLGFLGVLLPWAAARADAVDLSFAGGGRGRYSSDSNDREASAASWGAMVEYLPLDRLGISFGVIHSAYDFRDDSRGFTGRAVDGNEFAITARGYLRPGAAILPYALWGLSAYQLRSKANYVVFGPFIPAPPATSQIRRLTEFGIHTGLGLDVPLRHGVHVGLEGQMHFIASQGTSAAELAAIARVGVPLIRPH